MADQQTIKLCNDIHNVTLPAENMKSSWESLNALRKNGAFCDVTFVSFSKSYQSYRIESYQCANSVPTHLHDNKQQKSCCLAVHGRDIIRRRYSIWACPRADAVRSVRPSKMVEKLVEEARYAIDETNVYGSVRYR